MFGFLIWALVTLQRSSECYLFVYVSYTSIRS